VLIYDERVGCVAVYEAQDKWDCLELPIQNFVFYKAFKRGEDGKFQRDHNACDLARAIADGLQPANPMTHALRQRLEARARNEFENEVKLNSKKFNYAVCRLCGKADWSSTVEWTKFEVALQYDNFVDPNQCSRCCEAMARAPEVFSWVVGVMSHARTMGPTVQG
jgi:hypothetical protein